MDTASLIRVVDDPEVVRLARMFEYDRQKELGRLVAVEQLQRPEGVERDGANPYALSERSSPDERNRWFAFEVGYARTLEQAGLDVEVRSPEVELAARVQRAAEREQEEKRTLEGLPASERPFEEGRRAFRKAMVNDIDEADATGNPYPLRPMASRDERERWEGFERGYHAEAREQGVDIGEPRRADDEIARIRERETAAAGISL